jgi:hypothetical protein
VITTLETWRVLARVVRWCDIIRIQCIQVGSDIQYDPAGMGTQMSKTVLDAQGFAQVRIVQSGKPDVATSVLRASVR